MESTIEKKDNIGSNRKIKVGAFLSYFTIIFEIVVNFFVIHWITRQLGDDYAIYSLATSIIGLFLVDFGLNQAVNKFVCQFRIEGDKEGEAKFLGIVLKLYLLLDVLIIAVAIGFYFFIDVVYAGLTLTERETFKAIYIMVAIYIALSVPLLPTTGILNAHEKFVSVKVLSMGQKVLAAVLFGLCLIFHLDVIFFVGANVVSALVVAIVRAIAVFKSAKVSISFFSWDGKIAREVLSFTIWIAISSIATSFGLSLLSTIMANFSDSATIAVLSMAITFANYAALFSSTTGPVFIPKLAKLTNDNDVEGLNRFFLKTGKFQIALVGLILVGWIVLGKPFLGLYLSPMYADAYLPSAILIFTIFISSPFVVAESHSYLSSAVKYSALGQLAFAVIRVALCWVGGKFFGLIGISCAYLISQTLMFATISAFVYKKRQKLRFIPLLLRGYLKWLIPAGFTIVLGILLNAAIPVATWAQFVITGVVIVIFYLLCTFLFYFDKSESDFIIYSVINKIGVVRSFVLRFGKKSTVGIPMFFCSMIVMLGFFCSDYYDTSISLYVAICITFLVVPFYIAYCFPFKLLCSKAGLRKFRLYFGNIGFSMMFLLLVSGFITILLTWESAGTIFGCLQLLLFLSIAFLFTQCFDFQTFRASFKFFFDIVCIVSLVLLAATNIFQMNFSLTTGGRYYNYFGIFFSFYNDNYLSHNMAIFWEPGIFSSFCIFAIVLECLFHRTTLKKKIPSLLLYIVCCISCFSQAGNVMLVFTIPLILSCILKRRNIQEAINWITIGGLCLFAVVFFFTPDLVLLITGKGTSYTTRALALTVDFSLFLQHPFFGVGADYENQFFALAEQMYGSSVEVSISTTGYYVATFGLVAVLLLFVTVISFLSLRNISLSTRIILLILFLIIFNKEPHAFSFLTLCLLFYAMKHSSLLGWNEKRIKEFKAFALVR